ISGCTRGTRYERRDRAFRSNFVGLHGGGRAVGVAASQWPFFPGADHFRPCRAPVPGRSSQRRAKSAITWPIVTAADHRATDSVDPSPRGTLCTDEREHLL